MKTAVTIASAGFLTGGLSASNLALLAILVQPDLIAVSLFPVAIALPIGLFNCAYVAAILTFAPKMPDLQHSLATQGFYTYASTLSIQLIIILVSWVWVNSAKREMQRANQAEEINKLTQDLSVQQQKALQEKQQLEKSIEQVTAVHMQVANGNFNARVPLDQQNVLWPLAGSLNNLLARLQRMQQASLQQQRSEKAIEHMLLEVQNAKRRGHPIQIQPTGTLLDTLIKEIAPDPALFSSSPMRTHETLNAPLLPDSNI